jgi:hypothetical protein
MGAIPIRILRRYSDGGFETQAGALFRSSSDDLFFEQGSKEIIEYLGDCVIIITPTEEL